MPQKLCHWFLFLLVTIPSTLVLVDAWSTASISRPSSIPPRRRKSQRDLDLALDESTTTTLTSIRRRDFLGVATTTPLLIQLLLTTQYPAPCHAAEAATTTVGEAIRVGAANIPGLGPPDVYYPLAFQGIWTMHRQIMSAAAADDDDNDDDGDDKSINLFYAVRFLPSVQDNAVVADRGFNQANLEAAIRGGGGGGGGADAAAAAAATVQSYSWTPSNPNDLRIAFKDGGLKDIRVTKRATERTDSTVFSSEFQRVTTTSRQDDGREIPVITARRVLTKWKVRNNTEEDKKNVRIEGLEMIYNVGGGGDPLSLQVQQPQQDQPSLLFKSRLVLERPPSN